MGLTCHESMAAEATDEDPLPGPWLSANPAPSTPQIPADPTHSESASDQEEVRPEILAERSQAGCLESFEQLVSYYESQIFNFHCQFTSNRHDAEDLTQETFLRAYRSLPRYKPSLSFATWLFTIARRSAASHCRSSIRTEAPPIEAETDLEDPATLLERKDDHQSLWSVVRTLKPKQSEALWLRYSKGFSIAETARIMNTNQIQVRVLLHRARARLSKMLLLRTTGSANSINRPEKGS